MAKRSNNSLSRRSYGGKPYDANNSFVKKMATKVTDLIPQRSWISKWFNTSQDNGDVSNVIGNSDEVDTEEEEISQQPPAKRPRIRMDVTHPPGTFSIRARDKQSSNDNDSRRDTRFSGEDETEEYFLEPAVAGPSGSCKFVSSTPAVHTETRKSNTQSVQQPIGSLITMENNGPSNGADDNSESGESTSGCSSLIPQTNRQDGVGNSAYGSRFEGGRRFMNDKSSFANNLQSPRCLFLENGSRESFNSRRPSFNASMMMNNNSNNMLDRTSALSSPFYSGNVTFGGSNALGHIQRSRSLFNSNNEFQLKIPRRTSVKVKPSNTEGVIDASGMSQTAKRILEAMEYFSSPIADAKKIPMKNQSNTGKKRMRDEQVGSAGSPSLLPTARVGLRHLTRELAVPTVPDMLKLRRRKKLQDTTVAARKIISAMSGVGASIAPPSVTTTSRTKEPVPASEDYHLRTELDQSSKYHGKLRGKSKIEGGPAPSVNLASISLPITSLPNFEPLPKYTAPASRENDRRGFKFASPIKITEAAWNLKSINNFSFSKPINARADELDSTKIVGTKSSDDGAATNFMWSSSSTAPRLRMKTKKPNETSEDSTSAIAPLFGSPTNREMVKLKSENIGDVQAMESSSQKASFGSRTLNSEIWECTECYIKNDSKENVCVACKATKPRKATMNDEISTRLSVPIVNEASETAGFGSQFKMNVNQWECESCLVRNKQTSLRCVSCSTPKAVTTKNPTASEPLSATSQIPVEKSSDLMDKFKPPEGSWECPGCMLRNPTSVITCPCCNAAKPSLRKISPKKTNLDKNTADVETSKKPVENSTIMDKFKPATSSWECSSCMVRNNESASSCVCCSNPKPGAASISRESPQSVISASGWADKFKKPEGSWTCDSCMIQNKPDVTECIACETVKPGATPKPRSTATSNFSFGIPTAQNAPTFNFGIDKAGEKLKTETSLVSTNGFSFGGKTPQIDADSSQFTFGMPKKTEDSETSSKVATKPTTGFVFASPKTPKQAHESERVESTVGRDENKIESFSFGQPNVSDEKIVGQKSATFGGDTAGTAGTKSVQSKFVFGTPKSEDNRVETSKSKINCLGGVTSEGPKPSLFGGQVSQSVTGNLTNPINQGIGLGKSIGPSSEEKNGKSSNLDQSPFTFSEPKSKLASSSMPLIFGSTPVTSATPSTLVTPETDNKSSAVPNFGTGSNAFGGSFVPSSSPSAILGETSANDAKQQKTCPAFPSAEKKPSIFDAPAEKKQQTVFGGTVEKKCLFGNPDKSTAVFGTSDKPLTTSGNSIFNAPVSTPVSSSGFPGASSSGNSQPLFGSSTTPVFGGNNTPNFVAGSMPNIFATGEKSSVPTTPSSNLFTFGGANTQQVLTPATQPTPGGLNFSTPDSGSQSSSSTAKPIFAFGSGTGSQQNDCFGGAGAPARAGVAFGTSATTNPVSSPFGTFNPSGSKQDPPAPPPAFGQATAPTAAIPSIFGAQQPISTSMGQQPTSGGFNFGATASAPISGGFNFGGAMAQQPATGTSGGFNFNAVAPSPAVAFDPNTRPSFNFTGGSAPTAFNATPQPAAARKIKKAVRRMQQR